MGYANGKITAPVRIEDLRKCFGLAGGDLGELYAKADVNIWAKYKPVDYNGLDTVTGQIDTSTKRWLTSATWWKGAHGNCGLTPAAFRNYAYVKNAYEGNDTMRGWTYERGSIYRLPDFNQYNHSAECPIYDVSVSPTSIAPYGTADVTFRADVNTGVDGTALSLGDIKLYNLDAGLNVSLNDTYFGVVAFKGDTFAAYLTADTKMSAMTVPAMHLSLGGFAETGSYRLYPVLCVDENSVPGENHSNTFITIPTLSAMSLSVTPTAQTHITVDPIVGDNYAKMRIDVRLYAGNVGRTFTGVSVYLVNPGGGNFYTVSSKESYTVAANGNATFTKYVDSPVSGITLEEMVKNGQYRVRVEATAGTTLYAESTLHYVPYNIE